MKKLLGLLLITISFLATSCKYSCEDVDCGEHGTCDNGQCMCEPGWKGVNCDYSLDPCFQRDCNLNGTCERGTCNCETYSYGRNCEYLVRDTFLGSYTSTYGRGNDPGQINPFSFSVTAAEDNDKIVFNFDDLTQPITAYYDDDLTFDYGGFEVIPITINGREYSGDFHWSDYTGTERLVLYIKSSLNGSSQTEYFSTILVRK